MQTIEASVSIKIPEEYVLVKRTELQELKDETERGVTWGLADMKRELHIPKSLPWIREAVLKPNRQEIDRKNGGWCVFGEGTGHRYSVQPSGARKWFEENWKRIDWDEPLEGYE